MEMPSKLAKKSPLHRVDDCGAAIASAAAWLRDRCLGETYGKLGGIG
jgi:hypothetical protein